MLQIYLPYVVSVEPVVDSTTNQAHGYPLESQASFCTGYSGRPIGFSTRKRAEEFVDQVLRRVNLILDLGCANELEFPGLTQNTLEMDPSLPEMIETSGCSDYITKNLDNLISLGKTQFDIFQDPIMVTIR